MPSMSLMERWPDSLRSMCHTCPISRPRRLGDRGCNRLGMRTDPFGRVHGQENLYLVGASVFPTGGAVNPTFTLHATTLRTVSRIIDRGHGSGPTGS
ncbi:MAG: GMC oxidoreductase [Acetobacteraceae bacterium]